MERQWLWEVCPVHLTTTIHWKPKYLGITVSYNLSSSEHISDIVARAKRVIGLIYRKFYHLCNTSTLRKPYLTLVRLILEYCCHVWDPFLHKDIELLESVQKFAFRVCTKCWREPHNHLRNLLKLPLLKDRKKLKLTMVYKCLNGLMVMPSNNFPRAQWTIQAGIWDHMEAYFCIYQPFAHTNSYLHSCVPSSVSSLNQLPENFHDCLSLPSFKSLIDNIDNYFFRVNFALGMLFFHPVCIYLLHKFV